MDWQPIETAPKGPISHNCANDFAPRHAGPEIILLVPFDNPTVSVGWWSPQDGCWRHTQDDGPFDIQPTHWMPLPPPPVVP